MSFDNIIGHEKIINNFKNAIESGHIAHSYIFEGPKGVGKKTTAIALAKVLLGEEVQEDNQPDLVIIDTEDNSIKVSEMEDLQRDIITKPFRGNKKVYIICEADKMVVAAQNKFLKILEEPPDYVTIILITENKEKLLPTIVSRCQPLVFNYASDRKIEQLLVDGFDITEEKAKFISSFSNGIVGRAILLSEDEDFIKLRDDVINAIDITITGSKEKIFTTNELFEKNKDNIDEILDIMLFYFRDLIIYGETTNENYIINKDKIDYIEKHHNSIEESDLHDIIKTITNTKDNINLKVNFSLNIEIMLLEIQEGIRWQL